MSGERGGEHVVGVDLMSGGGLAAPLINGGRIEWFRISACQSGQGCSRVAWSTMMLTSGSNLPITPDPAAAVKSPTGRRSAVGRRCDPTVTGSSVTPFGFAGSQSAWNSLSQNRFEDLFDHRPGGDTTSSIEIDPFPGDADMSITPVVGPLMRGMGPVGISECLPSTDDDSELIEPQALGVTDQQFGRGRELFGAARIGEHLGQHMRLGKPEHTAMRRSTASVRRATGVLSAIVLVSPEDQLQVALAHPDTDA